MIRVLIGDDHPLVRQGLRDCLHRSGIGTVVGEAATGTEVLRLVAELEQLDVLVLDLSMPDLGGLEVLSRLHAERPSLPVLVLSLHTADEFGVPVLRAGARGFVSKQEPPARVLTAIRVLAEGRRYIGAGLAEHLAAAVAEGSSRHPEFSIRELQVIRGLAEGRARTDIAKSLAISPATVSTYKRRARTKLGCSTDGDLIRHALRVGLVE